MADPAPVVVPLRPDCRVESSAQQECINNVVGSLAEWRDRSCRPAEAICYVIFGEDGTPAFGCYASSNKSLRMSAAAVIMHQEAVDDMRGAADDDLEDSAG